MTTTYTYTEGPTQLTLSAGATGILSSPTVVRDTVLIRNLTPETLVYVGASSGITEDTSLFAPILPGYVGEFGLRTGQIYVIAYSSSGTVVGDCDIVFATARESNAETRAVLQALETQCTDSECEPELVFSNMYGADYTYVDFPALSLNIGDVDLAGYDSIEFRVDGTEIAWLTATISNEGVAGQQKLNLTISELPLGYTTIYAYVLDGSTTLAVKKFQLRGY